MSDFQETFYWRIYCNTEQQFTKGWSDSAPQRCFNDSRHNVNPDSVLNLGREDSSQEVLKTNDQQELSGISNIYTNGFVQLPNITDPVTGSGVRLYAKNDGLFYRNTKDQIYQLGSGGGSGEPGLDNYFNYELLEEIEINSRKPINIVSFRTPELESGKYRINLSLILSGYGRNYWDLWSNTNTEFALEINSDPVEEFSIQLVLETELVPMSNFSFVDLESGSHLISLKANNTNSRKDNTHIYKNIRIDGWRVV